MATLPASTTDAQIANDLFNKLVTLQRPHSTNQIWLSVRDGFVRLGGWLDSYAKCWAAGELANHFPGVREVTNEIVVNEPESTLDLDSSVASAALIAVRREACIPDGKIQVLAFEGWVTLEGEVEWEFERRAAEQVVRRVPRVKGVVNLIRLRQPP